MKGYLYEGDYNDGKKHGPGHLFPGDGSEYEGQFKNNKLHGKGINVYPNGDKYDGQWDSNHWHGTGEVVRSNGDTYKGQVWNGEFQGLGEYVWKGQYGIQDSTYKGRYYKGRRAGAGDRTFHDGSRFRGDFFNNKMHGEGIMQFTNGNVYVGEFVDDRPDGSGVMTFAHGARYEGQYKEGRPCGKGKYIYADGSYYDGEYDARYTHRVTGVEYPTVDGLEHGHGIRVWSNGARYEGMWHGGFMEGHGFYSHDATSQRYEGGFWRSKRHGYGVAVEDKGKYSGQWRDGMRHGWGTFEFIDGRTYEGEWKEGVRHGHGRAMLIPQEHVGEPPSRLCIGGVGYMYRVATYEGDWEEGMRQGQGVISYANGEKIRGVYYKAQPHGECVFLYTDGFERGGIWELGTRVRWLSEEEEEARVQSEQSHGAKSVVNFLQGGHQFQTSIAPMSVQQREEARQKKKKDAEDAEMMKKHSALLGKPSPKKMSKKLLGSSKSGSDDTMSMFARGELKA
jgi:hypothetical protein